MEARFEIARVLGEEIGEVGGLGFTRLDLVAEVGEVEGVAVELAGRLLILEPDIAELGLELGKLAAEGDFLLGDLLAKGVELADGLAKALLDRLRGGGEFFPGGSGGGILRGHRVRGGDEQERGGKKGGETFHGVGLADC